MRVLDVGCGHGDVTLIAAGLVGPSGQVLGIDRDARAVEAARHRAREAGIDTVTVEARDIDAPPVGPFDAIVGRRVLMYQADPARSLRRLAGSLRPGGIVAFHEHAAIDPLSSADLPLHRLAQGWLRETVRREGGHVMIGLDLHGVMTRAGLFVEHVLAETSVQTPTQPYPLASIVQAVHARIVDAAVATAEEVGIETLQQRLDAERVASGAVYVADLMVGAWARKAD